METPPTSFSSLSSLFPSLEMTRSDSLENLAPVKTHAHPPKASQEQPTLQRAPSLGELLRALDQIETLSEEAPSPRLERDSGESFSLPRIPSYAGSYCFSPRLPSEPKSRTYSNALVSLGPASGQSRASIGKEISNSKTTAATFAQWKDTKEQQTRSQTQNSTPAIVTPLTETPFSSSQLVSLGLDDSDPTNSCSSSDQSLSDSASL